MTFYFEQILWTFLAVAGLITGVVSVREARLDLTALTLLGKNGQRKIIATHSVRTESVRLAVQALFLVIGGMSAFVPPPTTPHSPIAYVFILVSLLVNYNSVDALTTRRKLATTMDSQEERDVNRDEHRDPLRDAGRDNGRDPIRDEARDMAHDKESSDAGTFTQQPPPVG